MLSNLVILPIEVNGKKLNFILDSGVGSTILFNISLKDSVELKNTKKIKLQGLGRETPVEAVLSKRNTFKLKNIVSKNQELYVIFNDNFDLSSKLGITIHGIIGYELLKDFIVKINYSAKTITFYKSKNYKWISCRACETFDLEFYKYKPYINVEVVVSDTLNKIIPVKLLVDSGGSDAMWLFERSHPELVASKNHFIDFLGEGLSGAIYGKRTKIEKLILGRFTFKKPTVSFPDSLSIAYARQFKERNGSLGANVLKRFLVIFDYKNNKMTLKKNSFYKKPFRYNMSGIELIHNGKILIKELSKHTKSTSDIGSSVKSNRLRFDYEYKYVFKPSFKIHRIRPGSPADRAGLKEGDIIIKINGKFAYTLKLEELVEEFYDREHKRITLIIERDGKDYLYYFYLENVLN